MREITSLIMLSAILTWLFSNLGVASAYKDKKKQLIILRYILYFALGILFALIYPFRI